MPYLKLIEQFASIPLACSAPEQKSQSGKFFCGSLSTKLGTSAGSTIDRALLLSTAIASAIAFAWSALMPPRGWLSPGSVTRS